MSQQQDGLQILHELGELWLARDARLIIRLMSFEQGRSYLLIALFSLDELTDVWSISRSLTISQGRVLEWLLGKLSANKDLILAELEKPQVEQGGV